MTTDEHENHLTHTQHMGLRLCSPQTPDPNDIKEKMRNTTTKRWMKRKPGCRALQQNSKPDQIARNRSTTMHSRPTITSQNQQTKDCQLHSEKEKNAGMLQAVTKLIVDYDYGKP
jgi:hypothetical protein